MEEIRLSLVTVTDTLPVAVSSSKIVPSPSSDVVSFLLKLSNGIEITKKNASLDGLTRLLQSLNALCWV